MSGVQLSAALRAVSEVSPFEKITIDSDVATRPVTVWIDRVAPWQAVGAILRDAGVNYVLTSGAGGRMRLVAGGRTSGVSASTAATAAPAPFGQPQSPPPDVRMDAGSDPPFDLIAEDQRLRDLERALSPQGPPPNQRGFVELPFPNPDGSPQIVVLPPPGTTPSSPFLPIFPGAASGQPPPAAFPSTPGQPTAFPVQPAAAAPPADPQLQHLIDTLTPRAQPAR
jgi:hypothetical protein